MEEVKERNSILLVRHDMLKLLQEDTQIQAAILRVTSHEHLPLAESERRFYATLAEIRQMREESERKWAED